MKIKSWYLVLTGIVVQVIFGIIVFFGSDTPDFGAVILAVGGVIIILASSLGIIPLFLLIFERTRKIGAVVSIIFGIIGIVIGAGIFIGIFLLMAGILALWKDI